MPFERGPSRFRRPPPPQVPGFHQRLEDRLRSEIVRNPPEPASRSGRMLSSRLRLLTRPLLHGSAAVAMALVIVVSIGSPPQTDPRSKLAAPLTASVSNYWAELVVANTDAQPRELIQFSGPRQHRGSTTTTPMPIANDLSIF